jgi:hypothetical protein
MSASAQMAAGLMAKLGLVECRKGNRALSILVKSFIRRTP